MTSEPRVDRQESTFYNEKTEQLQLEPIHYNTLGRILVIMGAVVGINAFLMAGVTCGLYGSLTQPEGVLPSSRPFAPMFLFAGIIALPLLLVVSTVIAFTFILGPFGPSRRIRATPEGLTVVTVYHVLYRRFFPVWKPPPHVKDHLTVVAGTMTIPWSAVFRISMPAMLLGGLITITLTSGERIYLARNPYGLSSKEWKKVALRLRQLHRQHRVSSVDAREESS